MSEGGSIDGSDHSYLLFVYFLLTCFSQLKVGQLKLVKDKYQVFVYDLLFI